MYANGIKTNEFKVKDPILSYPLCLLIFSKNFTVDDMKKSGLNRNVYDFSVDLIILILVILQNIRKHLMKNDIKQCLSLLKKMFIGLLSASIIGTLDDHISLNDQ